MHFALRTQELLLLTSYTEYPSESCEHKLECISIQAMFAHPHALVEPPPVPLHSTSAALRLANVVVFIFVAARSVVAAKEVGR